MSNGDFLLVAPPPWYALPNSGALIAQWGLEGIRSDIEQGVWGGIDGLVEAEGLLPVGMTVSGAKLIDATSGGGDEPQLWLLFAPNPPSP